VSYKAKRNEHTMQQRDKRHRLQRNATDQHDGRNFHFRQTDRKVTDGPYEV